MITIKNETIARVPTLHVVKAGTDHLKVPTIFFLHGFTSAKEHNLHVAYLLAERGFRVLLPDALHHGERELTLIGSERNLSFWEVVLSSIKEIELIKDALLDLDIIDESRIGVIGTSMGAITMYGALATYSWIKTAVSLMGAAYYELLAKAQLSMLEKKGIQIDSHVIEGILEQIRPYDLSAQLDKLAGRPLLIWHGKEDRVVPYSFSEKLYNDIGSSCDYEQNDLKILSEDKADHKVSRLAILKSVDWFENHLLSKRVSS
ncbi:esterase [bacterium LRH843]|nr:esterase [bacterium LRH843]